MHHPVFRHSFAVLVAPILLSMVAFNFLNRKKTSVCRDAEDVDTDIIDLSTAPAETNPGPSSSSTADSDASSSSTALKEINTSASSPSITSLENGYEVFLSFEGSDTREGFIDHLYIKIVNAGICAFKDDDELPQGKEINRDLSRVIKNSKILIPIISVNYGSSKWCLDELVQILKCKNNNMGHVVLPIFYKVEPTHVRHQIGIFGEEFHNHETYFDRTIVEKWKQALNEVSFLKGWKTKGNEGELVNSIIQKVWSELGKEFELVIPKNLVGIDSQAEKVMRFVDDSSSATSFVSIHRMRDLDREINRKKNQEDLQYHSWLWNSKEVLKVPKENKGTDHIKAIYLSKRSSESSSDIANHSGDIHIDEQFDNLTTLTFLHVSGAHFVGDFKNPLDKLRWRRWWNYLLNNFNAEELVALDMSGSKISDKWRGWSFIKMAKKLRFLNLTSCESLRSTTFLSSFKNLETLILKDCRRLEQIDSSIGDMNLKNLDLTGCESLRSTIFLSAFKNLEVLILKDCEEVEQIDSSIGDMKCLVHLDLTGCKSLKELPAEVGKLEALKRLLLNESPNISVVPEVGALQNLEILKICRTRIKELPYGMGRLSKLRDLDVSRSAQLTGEMPESFHNLSSLQYLDFHGCEELQLLPDLPSSLTYLSVTCQSRRLPSLSSLTRLKELRLHDCRFLECLQPIDVEESGLAKSSNTPFKLEILKICGCKFMKILDVSQLNHMRILFAEYCDNILEVRGLDRLKYLESLTIRRCASIEKLDLSKSKGLKKLDARYCKNLVKIQGLDKLEVLEELYITECTTIERLDLPKSEVLKIFSC